MVTRGIASVLPQGFVRLLRVRRELALVEVADRVTLERALDPAIHHALGEVRAHPIELLDLAVDGRVDWALRGGADRGHLRLDLRPIGGGGRAPTRVELPLGGLV